MIDQTEAHKFSKLPTEDVPGIQFSYEEYDYLNGVEGILWDEWDRICCKLGLSAIGEVPENYTRLLKIEGRWDLPGVGLEKL